MSAGERRLWGLLAEFDTAEALIEAANAVREAGYSRWDAHTPYPVHGLDAAMGIRPTRLPWAVLATGTTGCLGGFLMQWWMNAVDYPFIVSGKPFWSIPASVPVAFELTILFAALTTFFGMMVRNDLPRFHHPLFHKPRFRRATNDRFFLSIEASDPLFDVEKTSELLRRSARAEVEWIEG